jgi:serine O-acetyltransferase
VIIGSNVRIYQNVTIGRKDFRDLRVPCIGNDVVIGAGAIVLGDITIGDKVIIGANSVVISDVESGAVVIGIPARAISKE